MIILRYPGFEHFRLKTGLWADDRESVEVKCRARDQRGVGSLVQ